MLCFFLLRFSMYLSSCCSLSIFRFSDVASLPFIFVPSSFLIRFSFSVDFLCCFWRWSLFPTVGTSCLSSFISAFSLHYSLLQPLPFFGLFSFPSLGFIPVAYPIAFPIAYTMLVISGMVSALGNYRRRILFALSWISSDNFTFGSFSLGSIWSKVNGSGFPVLIKNIVQVLYPFLQVPHLYSLERSQLLQHPQPLALLIIIHNWLSNIAFFLRVVTSATWTSSLRRKRILWVLYFWVLETSGVFS